MSNSSHTISLPNQLGELTYFLSGSPYATMQILDIRIDPGQRRKGNGSRLFDLAVRDAKKKLKETKLRRVYVGAPQKTAIEFRAFLTHNGFHHVSTTTGLLKNEDQLVYIKSYT